MLRKKLTILFVIITCMYQTMQAQNDTIPIRRSYPPVSENNLIETKWKYTYTGHVETNNIVHKADAEYEYYLHLRHDYTFEHYLNGRKAEGPWVLNEKQNEIFYKFRNIRWWRIAELTQRSLVIEFSLGKASYQYNFVSVEGEDAPFVKRANELPDIKVLTEGKSRRDAIDRIKNLVKVDKDRRNARRERRRNRRRQRRENRDERRENRFERRYKPVENEQTFIEIAVIGGGFYGGLDPVIKDFTILRNTGVVVKEFESVNKGLMKTTTQVDREDMERFVKFIISKKFFDYENLYDCVTTDCVKRKGKKPTPIPLRLSVQYGSLRKVVTVGIWGYDGTQKIKYIDYPDDIELIVDGLQQLVEM